MSKAKTILLDDIGAFTQAAWLEDGRLRDYQIEPKAVHSQIGDVYQGKVERVVESLQAAFVDIGAARPAFLPLRPATGSDVSASNRSRSLLYVGQKVYVQLKRFATSSKAVRVSTDITLPGIGLIYCPNGIEVTVSQRIVERNKKRVLRQLVLNWLEQHAAQGSFIVRADAVDFSEQTLLDEALELHTLWQTSLARAANNSKPHLILQAPSLVQRVARASQASSLPCQIAALQPSRWLAEHDLSESPLWQVHTHTQSLFVHWGIDTLIQSLSQREVALPSGGSLVFDESEALTLIDVNSGSAVQTSAAEVAINTNLEACVSLAEQLRLRNLGGLFVIDFINLESEQQRQRILSALREALQSDPQVRLPSGFSASGLVELQRGRRGNTLQQWSHAPCTTCGGSGRVFTPLFIAHQIVHELTASARKYSATAYTIKADSAVLQELSTTLANELVKLRTEFECELTLSEQAHNTQPQYAILLHS